MVHGRLPIVMLTLAAFTSFSHTFIPPSVTPSLKEFTSKGCFRFLMSTSKGCHSFSTTTTSTSNNQFQEKQNHNKCNGNEKMLSLQQKIYGGDFAGQYATFSSTTGKIIPVPEHYVPQAMVEWGQIPTCLEVIVSEDLVVRSSSSSNNDNGDIDDDGVVVGVDRVIVQVMPEVGCGIDNLDTMKVKETIPFKLHKGKHDDDSKQDLIASIHGVYITSAYIPDRNRIEFTFSMHSNVNKTEENENAETADDEDFSNVTRIRVGVNLFPNKLQIKSPIEVTKERKTSNISTKGAIADGGGLDARTVSNLVGRENMNKPFSDRKGLLDLEKFMDIKNIITQDTTVVSLPDNIIVTYGGSPLTIEVSLIVNNTDGDNVSSIKRIGMKQVIASDDKDPDKKNSSFDYFLEEKVMN